MKRRTEGIYTTQGDEVKLIATRAKVNGVLSLAFVKNGKLMSHEPWDEINRQMYNGPCMEFVTEK